MCSTKWWIFIVCLGGKGEKRWNPPNEVAQQVVLAVGVGKRRTAELNMEQAIQTSLT